MDRLQRADEFPFISDVISPREFFEQGLSFKKSVVPNRTDDVDNGDGGGRVDGDREEAAAAEGERQFISSSEIEDLSKMMGCPVENVLEVAAVCDPENLRGTDIQDDDTALSDTIPAEGKNHLVTLEIQSRELQKRKDQLSYRQMVCQLHKYKRTNFRVLDTFRDTNDQAVLSAGYIPPDMLLAISLTKPYNRVLEYHEIRLGRLLSLDASFYVLGNTTLAALRDKISCVSDWSVMHDMSEKPDNPDPVLSKEVYKSGFFYINGVFYNDQRDKDNTDLSRPIMEWAERRGEEMGPFTAASMEDTKFIDLKFRLGQPYLYLHQGTCEHLIIFTDLRMMSSTDSQNPDDYPLLTSLKPKKRVPCCSCKVYTAKWVAYMHKELSFDPSFFCENCYRTFNYDKNEKKTADFKAMKYIDRSILN